MMVGLVRNSGGRPLHNFWIEGKFLPIRVREKTKPAALCKICSKVIQNTAKKRLMQHRKICKGSSSPPDSPSESADADTEYTEFLENFDTSEMIPINPEETEEVIQIIVEDEYDHKVFPHPSIVETQTKKIKSGSISFLVPSTSTSNSEAPNVESRSPRAFKRKIKEEPNNDSSCSLKGSSDSLTIQRKKVYEKNIDIALAKFIFGCNIPFSVVESDHFKNLISKLQPGYKLPTRKTIATTLLDQVYEDMNNSDAEQCGAESVLLIDGWKNSKNVVTMIYNNNGNVVFLESFDLSTAEELKQIVMKSREIARDKFSTEIYAVVSDNTHILNELDILHSCCNSHMGNLLAKEIVDEDIAAKVTSLQKQFKNPHFEEIIKKSVILPADTRWCDSYENFTSNLTIMRQIVIDEQIVFESRLKDLLFDDEFIENVKIQKENLDPICNLVNKCEKHDCNLADAVEMWLTLKVPEEYEGKLEKLQEKVFTNHALAANYLHPMYKGKNLNEEQIQAVEYYLYENLSGQGIESLNQFKTCDGIFGVLSKKENLTPMTFWGCLKNHCKDLSNFAIKLLRIPASSAQLERVFSNFSYVHSQSRNGLTGDRSKKLLSVYYSLKTKDSNHSDEY